MVPNSMHEYRMQTHARLSRFFSACLPLLLILATSDCHILRLSCESFADFSTKAEGHRLTGSVLHEIEGADANECKGHCVLEEQCKSINVGMDGRCQLNGKSSHDAADKVNLTRADNWDFYTTNYSAIAVGQTCHNNSPCGDEEICLGTCECPGYECLKCGMNSKGIHCNRCAKHQCQNGGTCLHFGPTICSCRSGYNGTFCERDHCYSNPCQNGGTCSSTGSVPQCTCEPGYIGTTCETQDHCYSNPCQNGGTCSRTGFGFQCTCVPGYTGTTCETREYSDSQWKSNCYYEGSATNIIAFETKSKCYHHCHDGVYKSAYIDSSTNQCYCSDSTSESSATGKDCIAISQDLYVLRRCAFLSETIMSESPYSRRSCYNHCVNNGFRSASFNFNYNDCYCSSTSDHTESIIADCISETTFST